MNQSIKSTHTSRTVAEIVSQPGRHVISLEDFEALFVFGFPGNEQRLKLWKGLKDYLNDWLQLEERFGLKFVTHLWIGGSFVSDANLPSDIDISIFLVRSNFMQLANKPGAKAIKSMFMRRDQVKQQYGIEVFKIYDYQVSSSLHVENLNPDVQLGLAQRGGADIWWQRLKDAPETRPSESYYIPQRGYVELAL